VSDVTRLLDAVERSEPQAEEELSPLVYEELRRLVTAKMASHNVVAAMGRNPLRIHSELT